MNTTFKLTSLALCALLTACGGSSSSKEPTPVPVPTPTAPTQAAIIGPHSTGSVNAPEFIYYDLDSKAIIELTADQAATNTAWDIAFKRTGVYLNQHSDNAVKAYATDKNSDFFDADGKAIAATFIAATPSTELDDYLSITTSDIPTDEVFL